MLVIRYFISILLLFFIQNTQAQNNDFDFESKTLNEFKIKETKLGSILISNKSANFMEDHFDKKLRFIEYNQIKFQRINDPFLSKAIVSYLSNKTNNEIDGIFYSWDVTNLGAKSDETIKESQRDKEYKKKYQDLMNYLITLFGKPNKNKFSENEEGIWGECEWNTSKIIIELYIRFEKNIRNIADSNQKPIIFSVNRIDMKVFFKNS